VEQEATDWQSRVRVFIVRAIEPHPDIADRDRRRKAKMTAAFLLAAAPLGLVATVIVGFFIPEQSYLVALIPTIIVCLGYGFARTRYYEIAAWNLIIVALLANLRGAAGAESSIEAASTLYFAGLWVLMASVLLSWKDTAVVAVVVAASLLAFPFVVDFVRLEDVMVPLMFMMVLTTFATVTGYLSQRDRNQIHAISDELREHADELIRARDSSEAANKAKSRFLANMSHELRTPLNAMMGLTFLLAEEREDEIDDVDNDYLVGQYRKITGAGKHLLALINDVLDISKIEAGKMTMVKEKIVLASIIPALKDELSILAAAKDQELLFDIQDGLRVVVDPLRLNQVLVNLIGNALKFTPREGRIEVIAIEENSYVNIRVKDNGNGIPEDMIGIIFDKFRQIDGSATREAGGTGLGLAISKELVEMQGGKITVESELGKGSTFTVRLRSPQL